MSIEQQLPSYPTQPHGSAAVGPPAETTAAAASPPSLRAYLESVGPVAASAVMLAAFTAMLGATVQFVATDGHDLNGQTVLVIALGLIACIVGVDLARHSLGLPAWPAPLDAAARPAHVQRRHRRRWQLAGVLLGLSGMVITTLHNLEWIIGYDPTFVDPAPFQSISLPVQFLLFYGGMFLLAWALIGYSLPRPVRPRTAFGWFETVAILFIMAVAFGTRVFGLDMIRTLVDELNFVDGMGMVRYAGGGFELFRAMSGISPYAMVFPLWMEGAAQIVGHDYVGLRLASAICGALSVLALWEMTRHLFDRRVALLAALVLATFPPHLQFSRIALNQIGDTLAGGVMLMFMARGFRFNRRGDWAFGGIALGVTSHFFEAGRLFFPPLAILWIAIVLIGSPRGMWQRLKQYGSNLVVFFGLAILAAAPFYLMLARIGGSFAGRLDDSGSGFSFYLQLFADGFSFNDAVLMLTRALNPLVALLQSGEINGHYYLANEPQILPVLAPFFLIGTGYVLARPRRLQIVVLLWVYANVAASGLFIREYLTSTRFAVSMAGMALLIAIGLYYAAPLLFAFVRQFTAEPAVRRRALATFSALGIAIAGVQGVYYFGYQVPNFDLNNLRRERYRHGLEAINYLLALPHDGSADVLFFDFPPYDRHYARTWYGYNREGEEMVWGVETYTTTQATYRFLAELPRDRAYVFFVTPTDNDLIVRILHSFADNQPRLEYMHADVVADRAYLIIYAPYVEGAQPPELPDKGPKPPAPRS